ncbi:glycoside hydrolase family 19 protein [Pseudomonas mosselii]|uniref:glycoside hydrolase family 19 protein n=1 Tax=Pseudomonas mosselii TaxID=78327 RepID=UPI002DC007A2|nr:glycoside hydrolase family 19 protein [Pseudomonas mosselii]
MGKYAIVTRLRIAAFLAQIGHESGQLRSLTENLNYSAEALVRTWPSRFTAQTAGVYARKPERIANRVYEGRMGNGPEPSGDGWRYRGRGVLQVTGRDNYRACSEALFSDSRLLNAPELLEHPVYAALSAGWFWQSRGLNALADAGEFLAITKRINGGINGLEDREQLYARALKVLQ